MNVLFASTVLLLTIGLAFCIGIGAGYAAICGILNAFAGNRERVAVAVAAAPAPTLGD